MNFVTVKGLKYLANFRCILPYLVGWVYSKTPNGLRFCLLQLSSCSFGRPINTWLTVAWPVRASYRERLGRQKGNIKARKRLWQQKDNMASSAAIRVYVLEGQYAQLLVYSGFPVLTFAIRVQYVIDKNNFYFIVGNSNLYLFLRKFNILSTFFQKF